MPEYFQFHVELRGVKPAIWRRFLLPANATFLDLHEAIQDACGWGYEHLFSFLEHEVPSPEIATSARDDGLPDPESVRLADWFHSRKRKRCLYWYDFGDDWRHDVVLSGTEEHPRGFERRLLGGAGAFPPEDCGGIPGYQRCAALARRAGRLVGEQERELLDWLDGWHPDRFDLDETKKRFDRDPGAGRSGSSPKARSGGGARIMALPHLVDVDGVIRIPRGPARRLAGQMSRIARAASLQCVQEPRVTPVACIRRPGHKPCPGRLFASCDRNPPVIEWECDTCGDHGELRGWEDSAADLRHLSVPSVEAIEEFTLEYELYDTLVNEDVQGIHSARLLYSAVALVDEVLLWGSTRDFEDLIEQVESAAKGETVTKARRRRLKRTARLLRESFRDLTAEEIRIVAEEALHEIPLTQQERVQLLADWWPAFEHAAGDPQSVRFIAFERLRHAGEAIALGRRVREILGVERVDYSHLRIFLRTLEEALERLDALAAKDPAEGCALYRMLLTGLGEVVERVHTDENELGDFAREVADHALSAAKQDGAPTRTQRPLIEDLLNLWRTDRNDEFLFIPEWIGSLELAKRERAWLRKEIDQRLAGLEGSRAEDLVRARDKAAKA